MSRKTNTDDFHINWLNNSDNQYRKHGMPVLLYKGRSMHFNFESKLGYGKELSMSIVKYQPCNQVNKYFYDGGNLKKIQYF